MPHEMFSSVVETALAAASGEKSKRQQQKARGHAGLARSRAVPPTCRRRIPQWRWRWRWRWPRPSLAGAVPVARRGCAGCPQATPARSHVWKCSLLVPLGQAPPPSAYWLQWMQGARWRRGSPCRAGSTHVRRRGGSGRTASTHPARSPRINQRGAICRPLLKALGVAGVVRVRFGVVR